MKQPRTIRNALNGRWFKRIKAAESFAIGDDGTVFLMVGKTRSQPGDGLVALTRYWLIEDVSIRHSGGNDSIYALHCV